VKRSYYNQAVDNLETARAHVTFAWSERDDSHALAEHLLRALVDLELIRDALTQFGGELPEEPKGAEVQS